AAVELELIRVVEKRSQAGGQCVLGGGGARETENEEENFQLVLFQGVLVAVVVGGDRGAQRAPDVVDGIAPLLCGQVRRVFEDLHVDGGLVLGFDSRGR